jgi:hypothetical protein
MSEVRDDPRFLAGVQLLERTGAREFRVGYSDPDDGEPVVWYATAMWMIDRQTGRPVAQFGHKTHEAGAAMNPVDAVMRLCADAITGGSCAHCSSTRWAASTPGTRSWRRSAAAAAKATRERSLPLLRCRHRVGDHHPRFYCVECAINYLRGNPDMTIQDNRRVYVGTFPDGSQLMVEQLIDELGVVVKTNAARRPRAHQGVVWGPPVELKEPD